MAMTAGQHGRRRMVSSGRRGAGAEFSRCTAAARTAHFDASSAEELRGGVARREPTPIRHRADARGMPRRRRSASATSRADDALETDEARRRPALRAASEMACQAIRRVDGVTAAETSRILLAQLVRPAHLHALAEGSAPAARPPSRAGRRAAQNPTRCRSAAPVQRVARLHPLDHRGFHVERRRSHAGAVRVRAAR
jgi:hypothetical protein